jgi:hypothetical protein
MYTIPYSDLESLGPHDGERWVMGTQLCINDKPPMSRDVHCNSLLFPTFEEGCRVGALRLFLNRHVPTVYELRDAAKRKLAVAGLELVNDCVERRLRKPPGGSPCVLQNKTLARHRVRVVVHGGSKHPCAPSLQCRGLPNRESICVVLVIADLHFETRIARNRAKVVEGVTVGSSPS